MLKTEPQPSETAIEFIQRAEAQGASDSSITKALRTHFKIDQEDQIKSLRLRSEIFWKNIYLDHARQLIARGGSRYAAVTFIKRKNGEAGQRFLTDEEIDSIVNSVGDWRD
ncbi:MAG: hypothetical protein JXQ85_01400 [Cognatishimia sp.]|uniref:hypothetical protein n=1 Tax=Cognatishimia sp. TaxID=2211648 RepID=UPI003B8BBC88